MTPQELSDEWAYRYHEWVGLLIGDSKLTLSADYLAQQEADEAIKKLSLPTGPDAPVKRVSLDLAIEALKGAKQ